MNTTTSVISGFCTCKLCGQKISGAPRSLSIGPTSTQRAAIEVANYVNLLNEHLTKRHTEFARGLQLEQAEFGGMRALQQFILNDPAVSKESDRLRWRINQATRARSLTDKSIAGVSDQQAELLRDDILGHWPKGSTVSEGTKTEIKTMIRERIVQMLTETRNAIQEPGKYPDEPAAKSVITTASTN